MGVINENLDYRSESLIIAFSSGLNSFDWFNTVERVLSGHSFQRIYLLSLERSWWHFGFEELGGTGLEVLSNYLKEKVVSSRAKRVMTIGSSMGGYGAIAFGCLLNVDLVISVVPQVDLDTVPPDYNMDRQKFKERGLDLSSLSLKDLLEKHKDNKTKYKIFYGKNLEYDVLQVNLLKSFKNVFTFEVDCEPSHGLVPRILVRNGTIEKELLDFVFMKTGG